MPGSESDLSQTLVKRPEFLLKMYETYNDEIARHFGLAWQAVTVFAASIVAVVTASSRIGNAPAYAIISIYLALVTWALEIIIDASYWYNRNLVVIANIERQFMKESDARDIQWYFVKHRPRNSPITFMRSLVLFLCSLVVLTLLCYFFVPAINDNGCALHYWTTYIPVGVLLAAVLVLRAFSWEKNRQYQEFLANAPGVNKGELEFKASEHDLSRRSSLPAINTAVNWVEDLILRCIGIEVRK